MKKYFIYDGTPVAFEGSEQDFRAFMNRQDHLEGHEVEKAAHDAADQKQKQELCASSRRMHVMESIDLIADIILANADTLTIPEDRQADFEKFIEVYQQ